jgi:hypothetical protein
MREAAEQFVERGWVPIALALDLHGKPKRPIVGEWTSLTTETALAQPWGQAKGIGVLLGAPSGNLAVIDIDDNELARRVVDELLKYDVQTRIVWTISHNVHVFFHEENPSPSRAFKLRGPDGLIGIELKATGTQVATAPTRGYSVARDAPPMKVPSIADPWASIERRLDLVRVDASGANYPKAWQPSVEKGERNKSAYIEAHRLREAGVSLDMALDFMRSRFDGAHQPGDEAWREVENTVRSAYRKGVKVDRAVYEQWRPVSL